MPAFWLTYEEKSAAAPQGWPIEELRRLIRRFQVNPAVTMGWWRLAAHRSAGIGDRVYLFRQGKGPRGIFGTGRIMGPAEPRHGSDEAAGSAMCCPIRFDRLVDPWATMLLPLEAAEDLLPASLVLAQASGTTVPAALVPELERRLAAPRLQGGNPASG